MTLQIETRLQVETRPLTLPQLGELLGIPIVVRPWWGSIRGTPGHLHGWRCPGVIKQPEVQNGVVVFWEGDCKQRYSRHTYGGGASPWTRREGLTTHQHRQEVRVLSVGSTAILVHCWVHAEGHAAPSRTRFLVGMDDGHPFVSPVLSRLETVDEAFAWLRPKMVREALDAGLEVKRQGDWFFVPYKRVLRSEGWPVDARKARAYRPPRWKRSVGWLRGPLKMNVPYRNARLAMGAWTTRPTRHIGQLVVYRSLPQPLVKGLVTSPDHPPVVLKDWHIAVRTRSTPAGNRDGVRPGGD